jgi:hypothetical protein
MNMGMLGTETLPCDAKGERTFALIIKYCILAYTYDPGITLAMLEA